MMRSLWSGVSGLTSHQVAMDVEGNNIANVNTVGFKYSRTNFEDLVSQSSNPAISPDGKKGGTNATQVGSGGSVASVQQIFSQGATQTTDKNTDMAINGEGFFVVSNDGGKTYSYTRAGNFTFDANGNLTMPNGMIVQGWMANDDYEINATGGLQNITIEPGLTTPAKKTEKLYIDANLNSGMSITEKERTAAALSIRPTDDVNGLYDYAGNKIELKKNIDTVNMILTRTFDVNGTKMESTANFTFTYGKSTKDSDGLFTSMQDLVDEINFRIKDSTGVYDNKVVVTGDGQIASAGHVIAVNGPTTPAVASSTANFNTIRSFDGDTAYFKTGQQVSVKFDTGSGATDTVFTYGTDFNTIDELITAVNGVTGGAGTIKYDTASGFIKDTAGIIKNVKALDSTGGAPVPDTDLAAMNEIFSTLGGKDGSHSYSLRGEGYYPKPTTNSVLSNVLSKSTSGFYLSEPMKRIENSFVGSDDVGEMFNDEGDSMLIKAGDGIKFSVENLGETRSFVYREPNELNQNSFLTNNFQDNGDINIVTEDQTFRRMNDSLGNDAFMVKGQKIRVTFDTSTGMSTKTYTYGTEDGFQTIKELLLKINTDLTSANVSSTKKVTFDDIFGQIKDTGNVLKGMDVLDENGNDPVANTPQARLDDMLSSIDSTVGSKSATLRKNDVYYFTTMQDLVNLYQDAIDDAADPTNYASAIDGVVSMSDDGRITIDNTGSLPFKIQTYGYPNDTDANKFLRDNLSSLADTVSVGSQTYSQRFFAASHSTSVEVFDSSGSKTQVTLHFRKDHTATGNTDNTTWKWYAEVPEPAKLEYPSSGQINFNNDGSMLSYSPPSIVLNANTGSSSGQSIKLDFGSINGFDGLTAFSDVSETKAQGQDGYAGGTIREITVDESGTLIGAFSNGKTERLATVGIATFSNNEGLVKGGGNLYNESANSGVALVGVSGSSNRGKIAPQTLEMSNVDLSRSLTKLITVQRGFQANSKTITTSDQMLNTLLQLKQ
ncbi:MAG: flagellar hook-basal body complex protein [Campylobacterales bacterium]|nr:flagellar hook-basal body complex protein [Campylobacterales bacterium]